MVEPQHTGYCNALTLCVRGKKDIGLITKPPQYEDQ